MDTTPRLQLPYILPSQAQKHVTHNEALKRIEGLVQPVVKARNLAAPPAAPVEGDAYVVAAGAAGAWAGQAGAVACFQDGAWQFLVPARGWQAYDAGAGERIVFDGAAWASPDAGGGTRPFFGINTSADQTNRLAVAAPASLFTNEGGDHRLKINKAAAANTASLLLQTAYSGRAEIGLGGDDDLHLKVSPDGQAWFEALVAVRATGGVKFPQGVLHPQTGRPVAQLLPAPAAGRIWRIDAARTATPRKYTLASVAGTAVKLTQARVPEIFTDGMRGVAMVRIWNVAKAPARPAWVTWNSSSTDLAVSNAADVAGWAAGDALQLGDPVPTGTNALGMVAVDIGAFLQASFGSVFPQKGVLVTLTAAGTGGSAGIDASGDGATDTPAGVAAGPDGTARSAQLTLFTSVRSPVSGSNLVFLRESPGTASALASASVQLQAVLV